MKKAGLFLSLLALSFTMTSASAAVSGMKDTAGKSGENINISIPVKEKYNTIEGTEFYVTATITAGTEGKYYAVECKVDSDVKAEESVYVAANSTVEKKLRVSDVKQGIYNIDVTVSSNGTEAASKEVKAAVINPYERNMMDVFTQRGVCGYDTKDKYWFDLSGLNNYRTGSYFAQTEWQQIEKAKGVYDFYGFKQNYKDFLSDDGFSCVWGTMYNNPLYNGMSEWPGKQYGPTTKYNFDGFANYAKAVANEFPKFKYIELYNEPNIFYWKPEPNVQGYVHMSEVTHRELKTVRDDTSTTVGVMAGGDYKYFHNMLNYDIYGNMDCLSYHPYIYPTKVDVGLQTVISGMNDNILASGGWKETITTEAGWPTHKGTSGSTLQEQAMETVKYFIVEESNRNEITEIYTMNSGSNENYNEDNFGIIDKNSTPKPVFLAIKELNQRTSGGLYAGMLEIADGVSTHMYIRDKQLTIVAWKNKDYDTPYKYDFGNGTAAYDMYGNLINSKGGVSIGEEPIYIEGVPLSALYKNIKYNMKNLLETEFEALEKYLPEILETEGYSDIKKMINSSVDSISISENPTEQELLSAWESFYANSDKIIEKYKDGTFEGSDTNVSSLIYAVNLASDYIAKGYMTVCEEDKASWTYYEKQTKKKADDTVKKAMGDSGLRYSEAMLKFAANYGEKTERLLSLQGKSPMKTGVVKAWNEYVKLISDIAVKMSSIETNRYDNILLQLPESETSVELGVPAKLKASIYNYTPRKLEGTVELVNPKGEVVGKDDVSLEPGKSTQPEINVTVNELIDSNESFTLRYCEKGKVLKTSIAQVKILVSLSATMSFADTTFDKLTEVGIDFYNSTKEVINGTVKIEPPEGWELSETEKPVRVEVDTAGNGQHTTVKFGVSKKTQAKYHFYNFGVTVTSADGRIIFKKIIPLSFTAVVKADREYFTESFDGNIEDWSNAYPIYIGQPEDSTSIEAWQEQTAAARCFAKWDENYLYYLIDVFDNVHVNPNTDGANIWNGDCIQLAIDPKNAKKDYESNCYEYGFAKTDSKGVLCHSWYVPGGTSGPEPSEYAAIIRDNSLKLTRYLIKLPLNAISPMSLNEGTRFGSNIILNDGDFTTRERFLSYAFEYKNPGDFPNFILRNSEKLKNNALNTCPIPVKISHSGEENADVEIVTDTVFNDIKGHWAEDKISRFAEREYVKGDGNGNFNPDRKMTRGEFVAMLARTLGIGNSTESSAGLFGGAETEKNDTPIAYFDISPKAWYAQYVSDCKNSGLINENIADMYFYPESFINREETCEIIYQYLRSKGETGENKKSLVRFYDAADISEWAEDAMMDLYGIGILSGDDNGRLNPKGQLTRAEAVTLLSAVIFK